MDDFLKAIKQHPNLPFTTIKDNVKSTTLKEFKNKKKQEQLSMDEHKSLNSQNGLNCVRAYIYPELTYDYKTEAYIKLIKTNPINRVFRQYISKNKSELYYDNRIPIQLIEYKKTTNSTHKRLTDLCYKMLKA